MKSYRDLEIYNESKRLAIEIHRLSITLPKFELYEEGSQIEDRLKLLLLQLLRDMEEEDIKRILLSVFTICSV